MHRTPTLSESLIQLLLGQKVSVVGELVCIAGAGRIILVLGAGLTGGVEELHEFSKTVGNLGGEVKGCVPVPESVTLTISTIYTKLNNLICPTQ